MIYSAITACFIVAVTVITIAFDVWVKLKQPDGNATISWIIKSASMKYPIIALAFGMLMGHFFWPNDPTCAPAEPAAVTSGAAPVGAPGK